jgi:hypothetical protein
LALRRAESVARKRDVKIGRATHLMYLEENRYALYHEAQTFLDEGHHQPAQR